MIRSALTLLALLPFTLVAYDSTVTETPYLEAACEGRWPGRFIEIDGSHLYDCHDQLLVAKADPFGCANSTLEECYGDE